MTRAEFERRVSDNAERTRALERELAALREGAPAPPAPMPERWQFQTYWLTGPELVQLAQHQWNERREAESRVRELEQERDSALRELHDLESCGHERRYTEKSQWAECMRCRAEQAEAEVVRLRAAPGDEKSKKP